jgi:Mor family transcriptional regulator
MQPTSHEKCVKIDEAIDFKFELASIVQEEIGMNERFALQIAEALVAGLVKRWGGQRLYMPKRGTKADIAERDALIRKEFNGQNLEQVMAKHGLSKSAIYKICGAKPHG